MKGLVVYDSWFGNTEEMAQVLGKELGAEVKAVGEVRTGDLDGVELLVVGSPVHGGRASEKILGWLKQLTVEDLKGKRVAVFDTRFEENKQNIALKMLMKTIGYAAPKMAKELVVKGGTLVGEPEGFVVTGKEGPLKGGELKRAQGWACGLIE